MDRSEGSKYGSARLLVGSKKVGLKRPTRWGGHSCTGAGIVPTITYRRDKACPEHYAACADRQPILPKNCEMVSSMRYTVPGVRNRIICAGHAATIRTQRGVANGKAAAHHFEALLPH